MENNQTTKVQCNQCGQKLRIPFNRGDLKIKCPSCGKTATWRENSKSHSPELFKKIISSKVQKIRSYTPKVGVFGVTGVGKSSLCNALFGQDVAGVSDVAACTRHPKEIFINNGGKGIKLIDVPGVGETIERDREYFDLYKSLAPELDLIIWVIKADDRAYAVAEKAYREILKPNLKNCPVVFVINQVDKLNPLRDWDNRQNKPGIQKQRNIDLKVNEVSRAFNVSKNFIETISVAEQYNLVKLMDKLVEVLPKEKKYSVLREASGSVKSEYAEEQAEKGIWDSIKEYAGDAWDKAKDIAKEVIIETAIETGKKFFKKLFGL